MSDVLTLQSQGCDCSLCRQTWANYLAISGTSKNEAALVQAQCGWATQVTNQASRWVCTAYVTMASLLSPVLEPGRLKLVCLRVHELQSYFLLQCRPIDICYLSKGEFCEDLFCHPIPPKNSAELWPWGLPAEGALQGYGRAWGMMTLK